MLTDAEIAKKALEDLNIEYQEFHHPAVFTCKEAEKHCPLMPGRKEKNFFLRDRKGHNYSMVTLCTEKQIDLKELGQLIGVKNLTSGFIDSDLTKEEWFLSHPLINTGTIALKTDGLARFFEHTGHQLRTINV